MNKNPYNRKTTAPANAISPLSNGKIHTGVEAIEVKLLDYPDEKRFQRALSKMTKATIGGNVDEELPKEIGEELFKGGLQTGLEAGIFVFEISGVSRACTHQIVRTRKASYHQQSSRYTNMGNFNVRIPETIMRSKATEMLYNKTVEECRKVYKAFVNADIPFQDARFICPIGIETYIICEFPIKTFLDTYAYRSCPMFQWEIVHVFEKMKEEVLKVFPWMADYIVTACEKTKKCTFQGWEDTELGCNKKWKKDRTFKSEIFTE